MIQVGTRLKVADNSGAKRVQCFRILKGTRHRYAGIGDLIVVSAKEVQSHSQVKKGDILTAVVVRTRQNISRKDGTTLRFDENAVVIIDRKNKEPKATRIFGPVARELKDKGFNKIVSLAPEVL